MKPIAFLGCVFVALGSVACAEPEQDTRDTVPAEIVAAPPAAEGAPSRGPSVSTPAPGSTTPSPGPAPTVPESKMRQCFSIAGDTLVNIDPNTGTAQEVRKIPPSVARRVSVARRAGEFFACGSQGLVYVNAKANIETLAAIKCEGIAADDTGFWVLPSNTKQGLMHYAGLTALRAGTSDRALQRMNATEISAGDGSLLVRTQTGAVSRVDRVTGAAMPLPAKIDLNTAEGFQAIDGEILSVEATEPLKMFAYDPGTGSLKRQINVLQVKGALSGLACE
jgi:hypothetical protein